MSSFWSFFGYAPEPETQTKQKEEIESYTKEKTTLGTEDFGALWKISPELCQEKIISLYFGDPAKWEAIFIGFSFWMMKNHKDEFGFFLTTKKYVPNLDGYDAEKKAYFLKNTWNVLSCLLAGSDESEEKFLTTFIANAILHDYRNFKKGNMNRMSRMLLSPLFSENNALNKKKRLTRKVMDILRCPGYIDVPKDVKDLYYFRKEILSPIRKYLSLAENEN